MAVTISFLIMTAVWTQIGRLQVAQAGGPTDPTDTPPEQNPNTIPLTILLTEKELWINAGGSALEPIALTRDSNNKLQLEKLTAKLKEIKTQFVDQQNVTLQTEDSVRYDDLVRVIDECIGSGIPSIQVQAALG
jgi:biopolymer transport protein ExbD